MYTPREKYRSTDIYRTLVSTGAITPSSSHEHYRFIPNHTPIGATWDVRHLDKFITNPKFGSTTSITQLRPNSTLKLHEAMRTQSQKSTGSLRPLKSQGSHYFKSGPRFTDDREKAYLINFSKDFTIKEAKNNTNNLVTNSKVDQQGLEKYCIREFSVPEKHFTPNKLEFSVQGTSLMSPEAKREQLKEIKINQIELAKWKEKNKEKTKKYRVYKNGFKSGILGVDNPNNEETMLYKEEHQVIKNMKEHVKKIEMRRQEQLDNWTKSDHMIEFFNRNFDKTTALPLKQIVEKNSRKIISMEHTKCWRDTQDRLFGLREEQHSKERASYLKSQESKGRNFDIISFAKNDLPYLQQT